MKKEGDKKEINSLANEPKGTNIYGNEDRKLQDTTESGKKRQNGLWEWKIMTKKERRRSNNERKFTQ